MQTNKFRLQVYQDIYYQEIITFMRLYLNYWMKRREWQKQHGYCYRDYQYQIIYITI